MSNVLVRKSNGDHLEITMLTLFGMLADDSSYMDVLKRLNRDKRITVELRDGTAELQRPSPSTSLTTTQSALPLCGFTADVRLHFELPARIHCRAGSPAEAAHAIQETIQGIRGVPADFQIELDPDEVQAFIGNLEVGCYSVVRDVSFDNVHPQLKLVGRTASP